MREALGRDENMVAADRTNRGAIDGPVILCLAAILGIGFLLRTQQLSDLTMHFDECCSWKISQFSWDEMIDAVSRDAHPPFYYMLMKGLGHFGGSSPTLIRSFSVFFGMATILAAFWFVRTALAGANTRSEEIGHSQHDARTPVLPVNGERVHRNFAAILAAMLVASSALHVEMSMQARPYTLGTFLTLVSATFLVRCLWPERAGWKPGPRVGDWIGFAVTATMLSLTHYYCLFTVAAEFLFAGGVLVSELWRTGWNPRTKRLLTGLGLTAWGMQAVWSLWIPVFLDQRERSTQQLWMSPLDWSGLSASCWMALAGGQTSTVPAQGAWLSIAVWSASFLLLMAMGTQAERLAGLCAAFPLAATVAYGVAVRNILGAKYLIFGQTFLLVTCALLVAHVRWRMARVALVAGLVVWSGYWCTQHAETREHQASFPGVRGTTAYLDSQRRADEPVIVGSPFVSIVVQKYSAHPGGIYVQYRGDHRKDMLGGPPLRESEFRDIDSHLTSDTTRAWTIDVFELFGPSSSFEYKFPSDWTLVGQKEFREAYGMPCVLAVREYRRRIK